MFSWLTLGLLASVPVLIYIFLIWNFNFWRKRGVKTPKPIPLLGTFPSFITQKQHFVLDVNDAYKEFKATDNYVGLYLMRTPQLLILDPKIIHEILVTNFKHFHDNDIGRLVDGKKDPLIKNNPFILNGAAWKEQRSLVSPGMTSSRIKAAYSIMQSVCHSLIDHIEEEGKMLKDGFNGKNLALRFTAENVSDCVLGIKAKSFTDKPLPVSDNVRIISENNTIFLIYTLMAGIYPNIVKLFKAKFIPRSCEVFFFNLMHQAFDMRRMCKTDRQDFLNHLIAIGEKKNCDDDELASISMTFLIDGMDTSAAAISHCLLLLGRNPEKQEKLYEEVIQNSNDDKELDFEKLNELPYLDACVHESIRIFPPGLWSTKVCTEPYEFTNKDGTNLQLKVGEVVMLPFYAIHHDPEYYPEPEKFIPERFLPENGGLKKYRDMGIFLGFSDGPRMCLGMRFALVQTKAAVASIVRNYKIKVNPKTKTENKLDPKMFLASQDGGVWLDFEKRY